MIGCQDADVLAAALSVGALDPTEEPALDAHLAGCAACRRLAGEYMEAAARLPVGLALRQPPPELRRRLMRAVYDEANVRRRSSDRLGWWRRAWTAVPSGRAFTAAAGVAALLLVALSSWVVTHRGAGPATPAPAVVSVALLSTPAAPAARGEVTYGSRGGAVVTATGLPAPQSLGTPTSVYEVWLIRSDGRAVAAAYLSQQPDGTWRAALQTTPAGYAEIAATIEPAGGSLTPTGARVLDASLSA